MVCLTLICKTILIHSPIPLLPSSCVLLSLWSSLRALHKDASLSAHISLGSEGAAGGLVALSAPILPSISRIHMHTLHVHSLQQDRCHHMSAKGSSTHWREGRMERRRAGREKEKHGWALGLSDSQMLPINFSGRHGGCGKEVWHLYHPIPRPKTPFLVSEGSRIYVCRLHRRWVQGHISLKSLIFKYKDTWSMVH